VHVRTGGPRGADELFGPIDERVRRELDDVTGVREGRHPGRRSQLGDGEILGRVDAGRVADQDADADRAGRDVGLDLLEDPCELGFGGRPLPLLPGQSAEDGASATIERAACNHMHASRRP
jgi:hypothetical protein